MGKRSDRLELEPRTRFTMCDRKRKFKSSEANRAAEKFGQRKYECPVCGHWHLTKLPGDR